VHFLVDVFVRIIEYWNEYCHVENVSPALCMRESGSYVTLQDSHWNGIMEPRYELKTVSQTSTGSPAVNLCCVLLVVTVAENTLGTEYCSFRLR
jgi:hypothetical protein